MAEVMSAAEANRRFYARTATEYDATEGCLVDDRLRRRFRHALHRALRLAPGVTVLDACGGSGSAGLVLAEVGVTPTVVDVSPDMLSLWTAKARRLGLEPETHLATVEEFLDQDAREWDLITFCSALHHLEDPTQVVLQAASRLSPGGVIFTMFDPILASPALRALRKLDWLLHLLATDPRRFWLLGRNALGRGSPVEDPDAYVGRLAERYAYTGIDDRALAKTFSAAGLEIIEHDRYVEARLGVLRLLLRLARRPSNFSLTVRRPAPPP